MTAPAPKIIPLDQRNTWTFEQGDGRYAWRLIYGTNGQAVWRWMPIPANLHRDRPDDFEPSIESLRRAARTTSR